MEMTIQLGLADATLADLESFLAAARAGGAHAESPIRLGEDGHSLVVASHAPHSTRREAHREEPAAGGAHEARHPERSATSMLGDAALRGVLDMLSNRQDPA